MRKICILYDEQGFQEKHGGIPRLFAELMKNLPDGFEYCLPMKSTVNEYLREPPFNFPLARLCYRDFIKRTLRGYAFPGSHKLYCLLGRFLSWAFPAHEVENRRLRMKVLRRGDYDIYHAGDKDWDCIVGRKPFVVTICDLIPEVVNHDEAMRKYNDRRLSAASHIIAISEYTKQDILRYHNVSEDKITVVRLGYNMCNNAHMREVQFQANGFDPSAPFVLYVGKRSGYKNFNWMIRGLSPLIKNGLQVVCTGDAFTAVERTLLTELKIETKVFQSFVSDDEMMWLFSHALAFVFPSRYEGFGIPILDAFAARCPAVLARASCFPEVAEDAALYFDPSDDGSELRSCLERLMADQALRRTLIEAGTRRVKEFSWQKCALETAAVYSRVLQEWESKT